MSDHPMLFSDAEDPCPVSGGPGLPAPAAARPVPGTPRLRRPHRDQAEMRCASLDQLLPPEHQARLVWDYVTQLDLTRLLQDIQAVAGLPGRAATDPRLLLALWLYATIDGVGSARELDRLCQDHLAYQWLAGGVSLNYHTLADFRTQHPAVLDQLLTDSVATLLHEELIDLQRVAQDGVKVRASAGASSFRRQATLETCWHEAETQVAALRNQVTEDAQAATRRQQAARQRAARERQERVQKALDQQQHLHARRQQQQQDKGVKYEPEKIRTSTTDPEAQRMKMPDGGTRPAYNTQFATSTTGGVIVGVSVTNVGSDAGQLAPMVEQIEQRYAQVPREMLVDGGFATLPDIQAVADKGVVVYSPVKDAEKKQAKGIDPFVPHPRDKPGVAAWRQRMGTTAAQTIYKERVQVAEWVNAQARNRGYYQVRVRGQQKVLAVALWYALAHNLRRWYVLKAQAQAKTAN